MQKDLTENTEFRIKWPRGQLGSLPADSEQFMMIEDLYKTTDKLNAHIESMALNKVNIEFLRKQMDKVLIDIEKLKDAKQRNEIYKWQWELFTIMVAFYNAGDQAIYNQGYSFIPQERFRLGDPNLGSPTTTAPVTGGINTLPINMGGGGGGGGFNPYNPDMSQIRTDFRPYILEYSDYGLNQDKIENKWISIKKFL